MRVGRVVLILGAGASRDCQNRNGGPVALSGDLARRFAEVAGLPYHGEGLTEVFQATTGPNGVIGDDRKQNLLEQEFLNIRPSQSIRKLLQFPWRKIYTLNIDDAIENVPDNFRCQNIRSYNARLSSRMQ